MSKKLKTHKVLDNDYQPDEHVVFIGSLKECEDFLLKQDQHRDYKVIPMSEEEIRAHNEIRCKNSFQKIDLKMISTVNTVDIIQFIVSNSDYDWNKSCDIFGSELNYIENNLPDEIEVEVDGIISKVIISKLNYDGWIKKFTETQEILTDYYILFTD